MSHLQTLTAGQSNSDLAAAILTSEQTFKLIPAHPVIRHWDNAGGYEQAWREGWTMSENEDGRYQLQKLDDPSAVECLDYTEIKFESDSDALAYVVLKAMTGSLYHAEALASIGARALR